MSGPTDSKTSNNPKPASIDIDIEGNNATDRLEVVNVLAEMEKALDDIAGDNPRLSTESESGAVRLDDLKAVLETSLAVNSSLELDEILQMVMLKAVDLLLAERGFIMLLDKDGVLQFKTAHNICQEDTVTESFKISNSIADQVIESGKSVYTSDAQNDQRYAKQQSIVELNLRSIMCVPLKIKNQVIGVVYLDNSMQAKLFLKSDLYLFELFAQQVATAIHNAQLHLGLRRLKRYNEDIIAQSPVGILVIDRAYNLVTINDASLAIFHVNREDLNLTGGQGKIGKFSDLVPKKGFHSWQKMIESVLSGKGDFQDDRYFHNTKYEEKVLSIKVSYTKSLPGNRSGVIFVIEDITESIILERYVILSEKLVAKGEMAASIGHELNNYLSIISNNSELMSINIGRGEFEKATNNSRLVIENIGKMKRFTDGLMDFSKLETELVNYDINQLIENLLFSIKVQRKFKGITIDYTCSPNMTEICIDVGQIQQVLLNLMNNAADALEKSDNPSIRIICEFDHNRDNVKIIIADNGHGMTEDVRNKIFENHFTTKSLGHGMGLANARKIILNHGGDISVESVENLGTTFNILLPRNTGKIDK